MKHSIFYLFFLVLLISCQKQNTALVNPSETHTKVVEQASNPYPITKKIDHVDTYFDQKVSDPYRWLEDDLAENTKDWVTRQNEFTHSYLEKIPYRDQIKSRLSEVWNYEKLTAPRKYGSTTYYLKNDGLQNQYVLYARDNDGNESVFLDPNTFSEDGTTSLGAIKFTKDGSLMAYSISEGGSDWRKIIVLDVATKKMIGDTLVDVKFSGISWKGNEGFYYSSYDKPEGSELSAKTDQHKLYYHKIGTQQKDDELIFGGNPNNKRRYIGAEVSDDAQYLFIYARNTTYGSEFYVKDLTNINNPLIPIVDHFDNETYFIDHKDGKFYFFTNIDAPNNKIVVTDAATPTQEYWHDLIPETEEVLELEKGAGFLFAHYIKDAISVIQQYDYNGKKIRNIELPGIGSVSGFDGKDTDKELYYSFANYHTPSSIYTYNPEDGTSKLYWEPSVSFDSKKYVSEQVFYHSKDGTKIPLIITYKKGLQKNGSNPTLLYGYGGFNINLTPSFSITRAVWMEQGGILAVANLRGGGEYGKKWHDAGTQLNKQNVFDDFIAAAEYLIENQYTNSDKLAIQGGSNGGLLVGACMTQRPELFQVALPAVGVLDMLRYHTFTAGAGWAYDYGTSEQSEEMFEYLLGYSPLHNVKKGVKYPATLITTSDHDDRVVPAHSFKYAAELQDKQSGDAPILIRIETKAGHGAGKPVSKIIDEYADIWSFALWNLGVRTLASKQ